MLVLGTTRSLYNSRCNAERKRELAISFTDTIKLERKTVPYGRGKETRKQNKNQKYNTIFFARCFGLTYITCKAANVRLIDTLELYSLKVIYANFLTFKL